MKEELGLNEIIGISGICLLLLAILSQYSVYAESVYDPTPGFQENAVFAIGTCAVGLICVQPPLGNWTEAMEEDCLMTTEEALGMFENESNGYIDFILAQVVYAVHTTVDPAIAPIPDIWVSEVMNNTGYSGSNHMDQARQYVNDLRNGNNTDWAIAILMVDMSYSPQGKFGCGGIGFAIDFFGPYVGISYRFDGSRLLIMHEVAHLFGASDEAYTDSAENNGYLHTSNEPHAKCIMNGLNSIHFCNATRVQLGWQDIDGNGIMDIIDNKDRTALDPCTPDPTTNRVLMYRGTSYVVPYPTGNPGLRSSTTTKIVNVEFRIDGGDWMNATPTDGKYDHAVEEFYFLTPVLEIGSYTVEVRSLNTIGNSDENSATDMVIVVRESDIGPPEASFTYPENITIGSVLFDAAASTSPNSTIVSYAWDFGDGNVTSTIDPIISHVYNTLGKYTVVLNVTNAHGLWGVMTALIEVRSLKKSPDVNGDSTVNILDIFIVAQAFGSKPEDPNWNPDADINKDDIVNILDVFAVAWDFGKTV